MSNLTTNHLRGHNQTIVNLTGTFSASAGLSAFGSIDVDENLLINGRLDIGGLTVVSSSAEFKDTILVSDTVAVAIDSNEPSASMHAGGATIAGSFITSHTITSNSTIPDYYNARLFAGDDGVIAIDTDFTLTIGKDSNLKIEGDEPATTGGTGGTSRLL